MWQPYEGPMGHPWGGILQTIVPLLVLAGLVAVVVWVILRTSRQPAPMMPAGGAARVDQALEHVRMRYARGEIDREQFQRMTQDLSGQPFSGAEPGGPAAGPPSPEP